MSSPSGTRPYSCKICGQTFRNQGSIYYHMEMHKGIKKYICPFCDVRFMQSSNLTYHIGVHTREKPYDCRHCSKTFARKCNYDDHIRSWHHKVRPQWTCSLCQKAYTSRTGLTYHMRWHTGEKPYKCQDCSQRFTRLEYLKRHVLKGKCHGRRGQAADKSKKRGTHDDQRKRLSNFRTSSKQSEWAAAQVESSPDTVVEPHQNYQCGRCPEKFDHSDKLVAHLALHQQVADISVRLTCSAGGLGPHSGDYQTPLQRPTSLMWTKSLPILLPFSIDSKVRVLSDRSASFSQGPPRLTLVN